MERCPNCSHRLAGIAGVPDEIGGRFEADVRCPECGSEVASGVRLLVGATSPDVFPRRRRWLPDWCADVGVGEGTSVLVASIAAVAAIAILVAFAFSEVRRGQTGSVVALVVLGLFAGAIVFWVLRLWAGRRRSGDPDSPRVAERRRVLALGRGGATLVERSVFDRVGSELPKRWTSDPDETRRQAEGSARAGNWGATSANLRTVRLVELWPTREEVVVQVVVYVGRERGLEMGDGAGRAGILKRAGEQSLADQSRALYLVLPPGRAAHIAAEAMDELRGRERASNRAGAECGSALARTVDSRLGDLRPGDSRLGDSRLGDRRPVDSRPVDVWLGNSSLSGSRKMPARGAEGQGELRLGCFALLGLAGLPLLLFDSCVALFAGGVVALLAWAHFAGRPTLDRSEWRIEQGALVARDRMFGRERRIGAHRIASIAVEVHRGVPFLRAVGRRRFFPTLARLVPDDWLGLEPAALAREIAERLGLAPASKP